MNPRSCQSPFVIVLILSYNGKKLLDEAIGSYSNNTYDNFKIVLIDNGSLDGTQDYVEKNFPEVEVIRLNENKGYSGGFNVGLNYAFNKKKADYVVVTNNDVKADSHLVSSLVETAEDNRNVGFVIGKVYFHEKPKILQSVGKRHDDIYWSTGHIGDREKDVGQYDDIEERDWCDDIYWLVSSDLYNKTGGYDTEFQFQAEDYDWQVRAKKEGFKIFYTHKAKLWHKDSVTIGKNSPFKSYYDFRNPLIVHMKYRQWKEYKYYFFRKIKMLLSSTVKNLFKLRFYFVFMSWRGFISAILWFVKNKFFFQFKVK